MVNELCDALQCDDWYNKYSLLLIIESKLKVTWPYLFFITLMQIYSLYH